MDLIIDEMHDEDWAQVRAIYTEGIATGQATFETQAPEWRVWNESHLGFGRLAARDGGAVVGWSALSQVSDRCAYSGVAEVSVYVGREWQGRGVGRSLLEALIAASEEKGIWTLQAGVFPENSASVELHKRCGFREVGRRERLGKLNGVWRDVLLLERRSSLVGL